MRRLLSPGSARRTEAVSRLFGELEARFGSIQDLYEESVGIITHDELEHAHLDDLLAHRACAVHIKGFYPGEASASLAKRLLKEKEGIRNWMVSSSRGLESSDVMSVGIPFNMVLEQGQDAAREYFASAIPMMRRLRAPQEPGGPPILSPLDKLRLELDELWPRGATVTKNGEGQAFLAGVARIMHGPTKFIDGFVHVDELSPMARGRGLFSANVYLSMPPAGGELAIWPVGFWSRWDFYRHARTLSQLTVQSEEGQALLRRRFPRPRTIEVDAGDLVLLCAQRPHAAQGFPVGTRVSMQSFVTAEPGKPLRLDN